jgi:protein MAK16
MRRLRLKIQPKLVRINRKKEKQHKSREARALVASKLSEAIKAELVERLQKGTYGDIYNFPNKEYEKVLDVVGAEEMTEDEDDDIEFVEDYDYEDDDFEDMKVGQKRNRPDFASSSDSEDGLGDDSLNEDTSDDDDDEAPVPKKVLKKRKADKRKKKKKRGKVEIEFEEEREENNPMQEMN